GGGRCWLGGVASPPLPPPPPAAVAAIGRPGSTVMVHTHLHVREDALTLYAFPTNDDRDCFEALLGAHGVGPALALAIVSVHGPAELRRAVADGDLDALTMVPGVGRKTAARLLIELKSRLDVVDVGPGTVAAVNGDAGPSARRDLREALVGLGYEADEIGAVLRELPAEGEVEDLLRNALRLLTAAR
ncbi:MAG: Holliday junction branch migration protein RuvA, partial [Acidimicrobiales bacterium]